MKMRKITAVFLCGLLGISLLFSSCGDSGMDFGDAFAGAEEENPYPLDTKVAVIYNGNVESDPLVAIFEIARKEIEKTLGAETAYMENVLLLQFEEAVEKCIDNGYNIIIAASSKFNSAVVLLARKYTDVYFISFGGADQAPNLASIQPLLYQAANVCGFISAYNTYNNKIGLVVDSGMYNAHGIANAFALGARELQPSQIELSIAWALSTNYSDTRAGVIDLIEQGCDIIFIYQTDEFGLRLCEELGVTAVGFGYSVSDIAPENYLTGMYMNLNTYMIDKVRNYMYGNIAAFGETTRRGLLHGTVGLIRLNENIAAPGTKDIADGLMEHIMTERSTVFGGEIRDRDNVIRVEKGTSLHVQQVFSIKWLTNNIVTEKNFSEPQTELIYSDLIIKK
ncbi:MAG: BMP family ABC transporter substrate-binding protein [Oscillospiraceae bacterium]|nr:BMP family ABC transporter substrate-binding protein [Oscillospiraceae bacterium]